jgi:hypothetical protein
MGRIDVEMADVAINTGCNGCCARWVVGGGCGGRLVWTLRVDVTCGRYVWTLRADVAQAAAASADLLVTAQMGVVIQTMVLTLSSGVLFTIDPRAAENSLTMARDV